MNKSKSAYICQSCSYESTRWIGQCPSCGEWNTFVETVVKDTSSSKKSLKNYGAGGSTRAVALSEVVATAPKRRSSGIGEFDRVLGGGFVPGQVILLAGDPGIGKSTLLTQLAFKLNSKILYVCGEESPSQIKLRTERMQYKADNLLMLSEIEVENIVGSIETNSDVSLVIIDSIQTLVSSELTGLAGSVGQVRGSSQLLCDVAKKLSIPIIIVGHVTKEGTVAGPKVLEHIVDTVMYLEGDSQHMFRLLRTTKNRFGPVSEVGVFEMTEKGMEEVANPSELFLSQRLDKSTGSCITVVMEGYRPMLFEIQALAIKTNFGYPKRTTSGFSTNRLQVLLAILEKNCGLNLQNYDVYLNVAGGFKVGDYGCDLAVCMAVASSIKNKSIGSTIAAFGECGLSGEIRTVSHQEKRIKEAQKLGYKNVVSPSKVSSINEAIRMVFGDK